MHFSFLRHLGECPATLEAHVHQPPTQKVTLTATNTASKPMIFLDLEATLLAIINILKPVPTSVSYSQRCPSFSSACFRSTCRVPPGTSTRPWMVRGRSNSHIRLVVTLWSQMGGLMHALKLDFHFGVLPPKFEGAFQMDWGSICGWHMHNRYKSGYWAAQQHSSRLLPGNCGARVLTPSSNGIMSLYTPVRTPEMVQTKQY